MDRSIKVIGPEKLEAIPVDTTDTKSTERFLWGILFCVWNLLITMVFAYICYSHIIIYTIRGDIKNILAVVFILIIYFPVSAKLLPYKYKRGKDFLLSELTAFLVLGYIIITSSSETIGLKLYLLSVLVFCGSGYSLFMELRNLKSQELPK